MLLCLLRVLHSVGHRLPFLPSSGRSLSLRQIRTIDSGDLRNSVHWLSHALYVCGTEDAVKIRGMPSDWVVVGVSGVTCGGKTTFAEALSATFPGSIIVHQDAFYLLPDDERHTHVPSLNHINWEIASSFDMVKMMSDIQEILARPASETKTPLLIIEGLLILTNPFISSICQHRLFFTLTCEECWARRSVRTYDPPDVPGYFEQVVWPEYERHLQLALLMNPDMTIIPGTRDIHLLVEDFKAKLDHEHFIVDQKQS